MEPTPKEGGLLAKVVPKHEQSNYVDTLNIVQELGDIVGTLFMLHTL